MINTATEDAKNLFYPLDSVLYGPRRKLCLSTGTLAEVLPSVVQIVRWEITEGDAVVGIKFQY